MVRHEENKEASQSCRLSHFDWTLGTLGSWRALIPHKGQGTCNFSRILIEWMRVFGLLKRIKRSNFHLLPSQRELPTSSLQNIKRRPRRIPGIHLNSIQFDPIPSQVSSPHSSFPTLSSRDVFARFVAPYSSTSLSTDSTYKCSLNLWSLAIDLRQVSLVRERNSTLWRQLGILKEVLSFAQHFSYSCTTIATHLGNGSWNYWFCFFDNGKGQGQQRNSGKQRIRETQRECYSEKAIFLWLKHILVFFDWNLFCLSLIETYLVFSRLKHILSFFSFSSSILSTGTLFICSSTNPTIGDLKVVQLWASLVLHWDRAISASPSTPLTTHTMDLQIWTSLCSRSREPRSCSIYYQTSRPWIQT